MKSFDKIFWINSKSRIDRAKNMVERFVSCGLERSGYDFDGGRIERFEAVLGGALNRSKLKFYSDTQPLITHLNNGEIGCFQSHREIYKAIKESGWDKTLIFEDDADFTADKISELDMKFSEVPDDWQMLYGGHRNYDVLLHNGQPETWHLKKQVSNSVWESERAWLTHAYAVRLSAVDYLLENTGVMYTSLDGVLADVQKGLKVYAFHPTIIDQDKTKSSLR